MEQSSKLFLHLLLILQEDQAPITAIDVLKQLQEQGHFPEEGRSQEAGAPPLEQLLGRSQENSPAPLEQLLAESSNQERGGRVALVDGREVRMQSAESH